VACERVKPGANIASCDLVGPSVFCGHGGACRCVPATAATCSAIRTNTTCISLDYRANSVQYYHHNAWLSGLHYPGLCGIFAVLCYTTECISYQTEVFIWGRAVGMVLWSSTGRFLSLSLSLTLSPHRSSPLCSLLPTLPHEFLITS